MPRPAPERLRLDSYAVRYDTAPRFGDLDPLNHLNNAALARLYEDARVRFTNGSGVREAWEPGCRFVVAEVTISYLAEGGFPDPVTLGSGVLRIGGSSHSIAQGLFQNGRCIGVADTTLVYVSAADGAARPLNDEMRRRLEALMLKTAPTTTNRTPSKRTDVENA
jgi:acyl-CoA thioester hydrolase